MGGDWHRRRDIHEFIFSIHIITVIIIVIINIIMIISISLSMETD